MSSGRFVVTRLPAGLCQEGLTHRFVFILIKTEKSRAFDGIRHGAGAYRRSAGHGRFRITVACRYQGCVHSAAEYKYPGAIVKELFFIIIFRVDDPHVTRKKNSRVSGGCWAVGPVKDTNGGVVEIITHKLSQLR